VRVADGRSLPQPETEYKKGLSGMNWRKHDKYAEVSEDGRYSVAKVGIGPGKYVYECWQTREHEDGSHLIATCIANQQEARRIVEEHDAEL
jgi:hypothetical protein